MKVLLVCAAGMSTSLLAEDMARHGDPGDVVDAAPASQLEQLLDSYDVALLAPQIRFQLASLATVAAARGKPLGVMEPKTYGMMDGGAAMAQARALLAGGAGPAR